jgi:thioredoxin 1
LRGFDNTVTYLWAATLIIIHHKGEKMSNQTDDKEIEEIKKQKIAEMLQKAQTQTTPNGTPLDKPIVLTDGTFQSELAKHKLMVVDFWAPWCGPCRMVSPIVEELAAEYAGKVAFGKMNVDENTAVPGSFGVMSIPTLMVFKDGKAVDSLVGACPKSYLESKFKPHM